MNKLPNALGGPVLAWELKRTLRGRLWIGLLIAYSAWLVFQTVTVFPTRESSFQTLPSNPQARLELFRDIYNQQMAFLDDHLVYLLDFQLILVIGVVPAFTASSLGQEKERGTLFALFGTQLTSQQIVVGKLFGRLFLILPLILTTLPVLVLVASLTGRELAPNFLALLQEAIVAFALGAVCLLFAIWIRRAADAIIASYLFLGLALLVIRSFATSRPELYWLSPIENLNRLLGAGWLPAFALHLAVWVVAGALCLRLGWGRLRKVCVEQRERRPSRRLWAFRPTIGSDPIRWRECYVIGLAPLPILRIVPRWLALLGVFTFSAAVAGALTSNLVPGIVTALRNIDFSRAFALLWAKKDGIREIVPLMGLVFVLSANLLIGVRCGTSVAEEKRRNTWDDLLLTARSFREITDGKMWGVLQAIGPYVLAYALPVMLLASLGGMDALSIATLWIAVPCFVVLSAAHMGIKMIRVPADMNETEEGGAFWFENAQAVQSAKSIRQTEVVNSGQREPAKGNANDWGPF